jgi:hypothetical protein
VGNASVSKAHAKVRVGADGRRKEFEDLRIEDLADSFHVAEAGDSTAAGRVAHGDTVDAVYPVFSGDFVSVRIVAVFSELEARHFPDIVAVHVG